MSPRYRTNDPYWIRIAEENAKEDLRRVVEEIEAERRGEDRCNSLAGLFKTAAGSVRPVGRDQEDRT